MFRKLLVHLFIVASLSVQASMAFACEMMGDILVDECCCDDMGAMQRSQEPSTGATDACCTPVALISADQAGASDSAKSAFKALNPDLQPQLIAAVASPAALQVSRKSAAVDDVPVGSIARPGTLTYLNTLRLRI